MTEGHDDGTAVRRRWDPVSFFVFVLASVFPILGFGAYFRNEDGRYLDWMREGIFKPFDTDFIGHVQTFRPVNWLILRAIYGVAGNAPLAYQLASAVCFVGAIVLMYAIGRRLFESRRAAFLSILFYFACFYFTLHFLYTPIQGFQFPLELLLVAASMYLFLCALPRGRFGFGVIAGGVFAVLAVFNHPVSAFLLPVLGLTLVVVGWRHLSRDDRGREGLAARIVTIIFFVGLWLLIPIVTTQEKTGQGGVISAALVILKRYAEYGPIFLRGINRVLIPIPLVYLIARGRLAPGASPALRFWMGIIAACVGAVLFIVLPANAAFALLTVLIAAAALTGWTRLLLALWFFAGMLPNLTSWVVTGVYMR
ncbi:MAG: glycosyltransferase family 39 protein, partial [Candidatus Krumholzibacteria bacterium]|nr:glycosyltransferase family 39 protein [Candidatus Krumholzibacteria bacterium]